MERENITDSVSSQVKPAFESVLREVGFFNDGRDDRKDTPRRWLKAIREFMHNELNPLSTNLTVFDRPQGYEREIVVDDIVVWSLCEHHLFPFRNMVKVSYTPSSKIVGLSKIPRIVEYVAKRPTSAERLAADIASYIMQVPGLHPLEVSVEIASEHTCCSARGVGKEVKMITRAHVRSEENNE